MREKRLEGNKWDDGNILKASIDSGQNGCLLSHKINMMIRYGITLHFFAKQMTCANSGTGVGHPTTQFWSAI